MTNGLKQIEFCIPASVNVRKLLIADKKNNRYINAQIDKYHWFLNALFVRSTLNKKYIQGDFIPMSTTIMEDLLGIRYVQDIKRIFGDAGIIETNDVLNKNGKKIVRIGKESIGYRLTSQYQGRHVKVLEDSESTFIMNLKLDKAGSSDNIDWITRQSRFHLDDLGIDRNAAELYVDQWYQNNLSVVNPALVKKMDKKNRERLAEQRRLKKAGKNVSNQLFTYEQYLSVRRQSYLYQIKAIHEKLWLAIRDYKGRRIHSSISSMWKELKQFLVYLPNPELQLVQLDCSNSQPFTLSKIILDYFEGCDEMPDDCHHYIDLVCTGELYKFLWLELGRDLNDEAFLDFKTDLFALVFYSKNQDGFNSKEAEVFRKYFTTVYQIIMTEKKVQYEQLAIEMQRVETKAVLDGALTYLFQKYKDTVPFFSIHDAIICPADMAMETCEVMLHYYTETVGATPHIKEPENVNQLKNVEVVEEVVEDDFWSDAYVKPANKVLVLEPAPMPDTTPLKDLQKQFKELFESDAYKINAGLKKAETRVYSINDLFDDGLKKTG